MTRCGFLGRVEYSRAVDLQQAIRTQVISKHEPEAVLLLEHDPVYTLGRNADATDVVADPSVLAARGISVHETNRGGQVTYHGPGQLVGYPILDLNPDRRDIRRYIRDLQTVLIATLDRFGIKGKARAQPEIGVWVSDSKIASFGVHLSRWVTMHGFALNVTTDLTAFEAIVPCGLANVTMASMESLLGTRPALSDVSQVWVEEFGQVFDRETPPLPGFEDLCSEHGLFPEGTNA